MQTLSDPFKVIKFFVSTASITLVHYAVDESGNVRTRYYTSVEYDKLDVRSQLLMIQMDVWEEKENCLIASFIHTHTYS